jgi:hypothetical protein
MGVLFHEHFSEHSRCPYFGETQHIGVKQTAYAGIALAFGDDDTVYIDELRVALLEPVKPTKQLSDSATRK